MEETPAAYLHFHEMRLQQHKENGVAGVLLEQAQTASDVSREGQHGEALAGRERVGAHRGVCVEDKGKGVTFVMEHVNGNDIVCQHVLDRINQGHQQELLAVRNGSDGCVEPTRSALHQGMGKSEGELFIMRRGHHGGAIKCRKHISLQDERKPMYRVARGGHQKHKAASLA